MGFNSGFKGLINGLAISAAYGHYTEQSGNGTRLEKTNKTARNNSS
jgi:hypothetical protein